MHLLAPVGPSSLSICRGLDSFPLQNPFPPMTCYPVMKCGEQIGEEGRVDAEAQIMEAFQYPEEPCGWVGSV